MGTQNIKVRLYPRSHVFNHIFLVLKTDETVYFSVFFFIFDDFWSFPSQIYIFIQSHAPSFQNIFLFFYPIDTCFCFVFHLIFLLNFAEKCHFFSRHAHFFGKFFFWLGLTDTYVWFITLCGKWEFFFGKKKRKSMKFMKLTVFLLRKTN